MMTMTRKSPASVVIVIIVSECVSWKRTGAEAGMGGSGGFISGCVCGGNSVWLMVFENPKTFEATSI